MPALQTDAGRKRLKMDVVAAPPRLDPLAMVHEHGRELIDDMRWRGQGQRRR